MKLRKRSLLLLFSFMAMFLGGLAGIPKTASAAASYVSDDASLLTDSEIKSLNDAIETLASSSKVNVRIYTVNDLNGKNGTYYLDDMEDKLNVTNAVFLLIDMSKSNPDNRAFYINTFDDMNKKHFNQKRRDAVRDAAISKLKNGDYYGGFEASLSLISKYAKSSYQTDSPLFWSWVQLLICLGISGAVVFYMAYTSGGKVTTSSKTYLNENASNVIGSYDHYIRTTTTRVKRESNNGGGGGSDTHTTSGGHSSGSSSGHF